MTTDPRQRLADRGYTPALWLPGGQHFLAPDGLRVVTMDQALAEMDAEQERSA
jgi:hypothetical protein